MYCVVKCNDNRAFYGSKVDIAIELTKLRLLPTPDNKFRFFFKIPGYTHSDNIVYNSEWTIDEMYYDAACYIFNLLKECNYLIFKK